MLNKRVKFDSYAHVKSRKYQALSLNNEPMRVFDENVKIFQVCVNYEIMLPKNGYKLSKVLLCQERTK